jgi:hypothetical protein
MATQAQLFSSSLMQPATAETDGSIPAVVLGGNGGGIPFRDSDRRPRCRPSQEDRLYQGPSVHDGCRQSSENAVF